MILVLAVVGIGGYFLYSAGNIGGGVKYTDNGTCYNSEYFTREKYPGKKSRIALTRESEDKLEEAIDEKGEIALKGISNLNCLEELNLMASYTSYGFSDISYLSSLTNLKFLYLEFTDVEDISPLSGMTNLRELDLTNTEVSDISPLSGMTNLRELNLGYTEVKDVSPLFSIPNLQGLLLRGSKVSESDCKKVKQMISKRGGLLSMC